MNDFGFRKESIRDMIKILNGEWVTKLDNGGGRIRITIDDCEIVVPCHVDNTDAIIYMLQTMIVTHEGGLNVWDTMRNTPNMTKAFSELFKTPEETLLQKVNEFVAQLDEEEEAALSGADIGYGDIHDISIGDLHDTLREVQKLLVNR